MTLLFSPGDRNYNLFNVCAPDEADFSNEALDVQIAAARATECMVAERPPKRPMGEQVITTTTSSMSSRLLARAERALDPPDRVVTMSRGKRKRRGGIHPPN